ncbi:cell division cycle 2 [Trichosporon asahii var. asahii CBS 8904]|uniref:cyclin-dependent kinase n=1 Tax=Trichosporon asahii var. asahii (strain CBS 8904) TaxID=1220162 RepID=K1W8P5_TRIAC|nr:cell division cycle 2 [Trichosporon asahii var. asahii CBS 8904]
MASPTTSSLPRKRSPSPSLSPTSASAIHSADAAAATTASSTSGHAPVDRVEIKRRLVRAKKLRKPLNDDDNSDDAAAQAHPPSSDVGIGSGRHSTPHEHAPLPDTQAQPDSQEREGRGQDRQAQDQNDHATPTTAPSSIPPSPPPVTALTQGGFPRSEYAPRRQDHPGLHGCRSVYKYTRLNHIEEGTYGVVFRARCNETQRVYALKKLKLDDERHGFPITSLREINALMTAGDHENVVGVREVVVGDTLNQIFIVMPFIEHDLKTLLADMPAPFVQSEVKTIMLQLLSAVEFCHANWIIKVADFGLARKFGDPLGEMTQLVVTLWYRSPELLLGAKKYTTAVDMWSVGCIFAELLQKEPLFPGRGEIDQLNRLRQKFKHLSSEGHYLLSSLLCYDPERRISAEQAGKHAYFAEQPLPKHPDLFPSFPSVASGERRHKLLHSPPAPAHEEVDSEKIDLESFV